MLALARAAAPLHISHAWGVFTPLSPLNVRGERRVVDLHVSADAGATWHAVLPMFHADASDPARRALRWFAPHQPRLDHGLYYEGMEIALDDTTLINPYFAASTGLLHRLVECVMRADRAVLALQATPTDSPTHVRVVRRFVRFSTPAERARDGEVWAAHAGEVLVDVFERLSDDERHKAVGRCPTHVAPLRELGISGWWAQYARAVGGAATSRRDGASRASAPIFRSSSSRFYWDGTERSLDAARAALCRGPRPES